MGQNRLLTKLVGIYERKHGPRFAEYLDYSGRPGSLAEVTRFARHGKDGERKRILVRAEQAERRRDPAVVGVERWELNHCQNAARTFVGLGIPSFSAINSKPASFLNSSISA